MKSLFWVESPMQLINAYEAQYYFKPKKYEYFVRLSSNKKNDEQMLKLINILEIANVILVKINVKNRNLLDYLKLFYYKYIFSINKNIEKLYIGNFESNFLNLILNKVNRDKIILLDDGAKTINIQQKFSDTYNYDLFTLYSLQNYKNQMIFKNTFDGIENTLNILTKDCNKILFLGLKLSEIGLISESYYLKKIVQISEYYKDKVILYIAHREEEQKKLNIIRDIGNIKVIQLDYPIELYGIYNTTIPYKVSSLYSTALFTMKKIYKIEAESFYFDYSHSEYKEDISSVYEYYSDYIQVTQLDD